jgi:hypothetical protein
MDPFGLTRDRLSPPAFEAKTEKEGIARETFCNVSMSPAVEGFESHPPHQHVENALGFVSGDIG